MAKARNRQDPYKNFKFRVAMSAAIGAVAGLLVHSSLAALEKRRSRRTRESRPFELRQEPPAYASDVQRLLPAEILDRINAIASNPRQIALFAGGSGAGKSMAAQMVADRLGADLYRVDLTQLVSKYIGETEKNLERVFAAAQDSGAVLLLDEAEALFGKRSEVKDSHDRYANAEVSYLLQLMETHGSPVILATNRKDNIDSAFVRRLRHIVEFPLSRQPTKKLGSSRS